MVRRGADAVDGQLVSSIGPGILALVGVCQEDTPEHMETLVRRILSTKLWPEDTRIEDGRIHFADSARSWRTSVTELGGEVLCGTWASDAVSQFTLYAKMKGTKPDFHLAMGGTTAQPFYESFLDQMRTSYAVDKIKGTLYTYPRRAVRRDDGRVAGQRWYVRGSHQVRSQSVREKD